MKTTRHKNRKSLQAILTGWAAFAVLAASAWAQPIPSASDAPLPPALWAKGNSQGIYLAFTWTRDDNDGFYVFYRPIDNNTFKGGNWYPGRPQSLTFYNDRLSVFFTSGASQSYDTYSSRTESRLPDNLQLVDCTSDQNRLIVLVHTDPATTENAKNEYSIVTPAANSQWTSLVKHPLPIADWRQVRIAVVDKTFWIFGMQSSPENNRQLLCCKADAETISPAQSIALENALYAEPIVVNHSLFLIAAVASEKQSATGAFHYLIGSLKNNQWSFTPPLHQHDNAPLTGSHDTLCFTAFGQNIAAIQKNEHAQILLGLFQPDGTPITPLSAIDEVASPSDPDEMPWFLRKEVTIAWMAAVLILVFWRRREMILNDLSPPQGIIIAPLWRRILALLIDTIPANVISTMLFPDFVRELMANQTLLDQLAQGRYMPQLAAMQLTFWGIWIGYMTLAEVLFGTTPGKMALRLVVLDAKGRPATPKQRLIRNLVRILECHPEVILLILLLTIMNRSRQRPGDLAANTIVAWAQAKQKTSTLPPPPPPDTTDPENDEDT